jgi:hypothetical protein
VQQLFMARRLFGLAIDVAEGWWSQEKLILLILRFGIW